MFVPRNEIQPEKLDELSERRIMAYDSELMLVEVSLKKNGVGAVHTHPHHQVDYLVSGRVAVEFEQPAEPQAQEYRAAHHDGVGHYGGQANGGHVGESEAETVEHNARAEYLLCAELNARHPCFGQLVAQTVGIKHSENYSHY